MRKARTEHGEGEEQQREHGKHRRQLPHPAAQGPQDLAELPEQIKRHHGLEEPEEPEDAKRAAVAVNARLEEVVHNGEEEDGQVDLVEARGVEPRRVAAGEAQSSAADEDLEQHDGEEEGVEGREDGGAVHVGGPLVEAVPVELGLQGDDGAIRKGGHGAYGGPAPAEVEL